MKKRLIVGLLISGFSAQAADQQSYASHVAAHLQSLRQTTEQNMQNAPAYLKNAWHNGVQKAKNIQLPKPQCTAWAKTARNAATEALQKSRAGALNAWNNGSQRAKNIQVPKLHTPAWAKAAYNATAEALQKSRAGALNAWRNGSQKAKTIQLPKLHTPSWAKTTRNAATKALQKSRAYALKKWHYLRHKKKVSKKEKGAAATIVLLAIAKGAHVSYKHHLKKYEATREKAATDIQRVFKGYQVRNQLKKEKKAATDIQSAFRAYLAQKQAQQYKREKSLSFKAKAALHEAEDVVESVKSKATKAASTVGRGLSKAGNKIQKGAQKFSRKVDSKLQSVVQTLALKAQKQIQRVIEEGKRRRLALAQGPQSTAAGAPLDGVAEAVIVNSIDVEAVDENSII